MIAIYPCMGGWCRSRDRCAHYLLGDVELPPSERLCGRIEEPEPARAYTTYPGGRQ